MSSPDDDRARLERLLAAADRVTNQPLPPPPPPRSRVLTIVTLGVVGVGALVLGIALATGGDGQPSTATQTTAVPTAVTTAVPSTTLPIVITFPPTTIAATTTAATTTSTTTPATTTTWVLPPMSSVRSASYEGTTMRLQGAVPSVAAANDLADRFSSAWGAANVSVEYVVADGVPLPDAEPLYAHEAMQFPPNGIALTPAATAFLDTLATFMLQNLGVGLDIRAYTDGVGPSDSNLELSQRRADAAFIHLVAAGVDPARMTSAGFGEASPVADDSTPEGRALNRRVEFTLHDVLG